MMFQASAIEYDPAGQNTILDYEVKVKANVFYEMKVQADSFKEINV